MSKPVSITGVGTRGGAMAGAADRRDFAGHAFLSVLSHRYGHRCQIERVAAAGCAPDDSHLNRDGADLFAGVMADGLSTVVPAMRPILIPWG